MVNKKAYPLVLLRDVENLYTNIRKVVSENSDIISIVRNENLEILIEDISYNSVFTFSIYNASIGKDTSNAIVGYYTVDILPEGRQSLEKMRKSLRAKDVLIHFERWIGILREYDEVVLSPEDSIITEYEREFYDNFELLDDDADTNSYDLEKQYIIYGYLTHVIEALKQEGVDAVLIEEAYELRDNIQSYTKRTIVKKLSHLFALIRKNSLFILKEFLQTAKTEAYKRVINFGFDNIINLIDKL